MFHLFVQKMADSFVQIYLQIVFSTKRRKRYFDQAHADEVGKILFKTIEELGHCPVAIKCMTDHAHVFVRMNKIQSVSALVCQIKSQSSRWVNEQKWMKGTFQWQAGYAAFAYSKSHVPRVIKYILNQAQHHKSTSFETEYLQLLKTRDIKYDPDHVFDGEHE
jgi:putative transposase